MNIVLVPGYMLDADLWTEVADVLAEHGDLWHADLTQDSSIEAMAARVVATAPRPFVIVGFSLGGYIAREVVRQAPDAVLGLVQIATSSRGDTEVQAARKRAAKAPTRFSGLSRVAILSSIAPSNANDALVSRIQSMGERLGGEVFQRQSRLERSADTGRLGTIRCPTLVVAAELDQLRSQAEAEELHVGIPGSTFALVAGSGHMIPLEEPGALLRLLVPWLKRLQADLPNAP